MNGVRIIKMDGHMNQRRNNDNFKIYRCMRHIMDGRRGYKPVF